MSFQPRPYQTRVLAAVEQTFAKYNSTLVQAPTGAGKTMLIAMVAKMVGGRVLVLQHREELVQQNQAKFRQVNPKWPSTQFTAREKRWAPLMPELAPGCVTFGMVPTLIRQVHRLPVADLVIFDECHHVMAPTWLRVLEQLKALNPRLKVLGVTATPNRADKKGLGKVFESVADVIRIGELIEGGYLVPPQAMVADVGLKDGLAGVKKSAGGDYDMNEVARLIDHEPITMAVIDQWRMHAGDRQTIVFCATVAHAQHVTECFNRVGVRAGCVTGEDDPAERARTVKRMAAGELRVIVNVATLIEGYDDQLISCVVLLRPTVYASGCVQMIGRGLRKVEPALHPGVIKTDCIVMDFGSSLENLGGLDQVLELGGGGEEEREPGVAPQKLCPSPKCRRPIPVSARECPLCGYVIPKPVAQPSLIIPTDITLKAYDLVLRQSHFWWVDLPDQDGKKRNRAKIADAGKVWSVVFCDTRKVWHAFAGSEKGIPRHLGSGDINAAMSYGDAFLAANGDAEKYGRNAYYMRVRATDKQKTLARKRGIAFEHNVGCYELGCLITASLNRERVRAVYLDVVADEAVAA